MGDNPPVLRPGERIGPLKIERPLGIGGMGEVYLARDERLERHVAVKLLPEGRDVDPHARGRMLREARAASALKHPNIVTVHDIGEHNGRAYIVMEYIDGETFGSLIERRGRLPAREAVEMIAQAADAVAAAHDAGVLHRDIKSANLMIDSAGHVKVLDFGLSKRTERGGGTPTPVPGSVPPMITPITPITHEYDSDVDADAPTLAPGDTIDATVEPIDAAVAPTATPVTQPTSSEDPQTVHGARMGTPGWAPPELIDGRPADARSDVFALGCVLYHLLAGRPPFLGSASWSKLKDLIERGPTPPSRVAPDVPVALDRVVLAAVAADPARRPATARALIAAAQGALPRSRSRVPLIAGLAGAAVLAGVLLVLVPGWLRDEPPPARADDPTPSAGPAPVTRPPPAPLTALGGCAYSPTFLDDDTVVFDLTRDGAVDLYRIDLGGAAAQRLTTDPGWEWRAARGASADEIVFLRQDDTTSGIDRLDVATGARHPLSGEGASVAYVRDSYFYAPPEGGRLRRVRNERDEGFAQLPAGRYADTMVASPDGNQLAMVLIAENTPPRLCTVVLDTAEVVCHEARPTSSRPAFSSDNRHVYYERGGIVRIDLATDKVDLPLPKVWAPGGLAVAPSGGALVYSDCTGRSRLLSVMDDLEHSIVEDPSAREPAYGPGGLLGYVRIDGSDERVMVRDAAGASREVYSREGARMGDLAFSPDGERFAFVLGDPSAPGIYLGAVSSTGPPNRITDDLTDTDPVFAGDHIYFTRRTADGEPQLMQVALDGGDVAVAGRRPRITIGAAPSGRVLLASPAFDFLYWWDPATGKESAGPRVPEGGRAADIALSPDGAWVLFVAGPSGQSIWRVRADAGDRLEKVAQLAGDRSSLAGAIDDRGRPLAATDVWSGELWIVPAAPGAPW